MLILGFLALILGMYLGLALPYYINAAFVWFEKRKSLKGMFPTTIDQNRLCSSRHEWIDVIGVDNEKDYTTQQVCTKCGFLPSRDLMVSELGLKKLLEHRYIQHLEQTIEQEFLLKEEYDIKKIFEKEMENGLGMDKLILLYNAGQTCKKRLVIFKIARAEEKRRQLTQEGKNEH